MSQNVDLPDVFIFATHNLSYFAFFFPGRSGCQYTQDKLSIYFTVGYMHACVILMAKHQHLQFLSMQTILIFCLFVLVH